MCFISLISFSSIPVCRLSVLALVTKSGVPSRLLKNDVAPRSASSHDLLSHPFLWRVCVWVLKCGQIKTRVKEDIMFGTTHSTGRLLCRLKKSIESFGLDVVEENSGSGAKQEIGRISSALNRVVGAFGNFVICCSSIAYSFTFILFGDFSNMKRNIFLRLNPSNYLGLFALPGART